MSKRAQFQRLAQSIMDRAGDLVPNITFVQVTLGTYDVANDTNVASTTNHATRGFLSRLNEHEFDWFPAEWHVQRLIVAYLDLPLTAKTGDHFVINSERWDIQRIARLPGDSATIFYIRRP